MHGNGILHLHELRHHLLIDLETAGGVEEDNVLMVQFCVLYCRLRDIRGTVPVTHGEDFDALLLPVHLQLPDRTGPVDVQRGEQRLLSLKLHLPGELRSRGGLAGALESQKHDDCDRLARLELYLRGFRSH